eukprot:1148707-Pelagomonas_calceolata.AAC.5
MAIILTANSLPSQAISVQQSSLACSTIIVPLPCFIPPCHYALLYTAWSLCPASYRLVIMPCFISPGQYALLHTAWSLCPASYRLVDGRLIGSVRAAMEGRTYSDHDWVCGPVTRRIQQLYMALKEREAHAQRRC